MSFLRRPRGGRKSDPVRVGAMTAWFVRTYPRRTAMLVGLLVLSGLAEGVGLLTLLPLLRVATGAEPGGGVADALAVETLRSVGVPASVGGLLSLIVAALVAKGLFRWLAMRRVAVAVTGVARDLRVQLARTLLEARWSHVADSRAGVVTSAMGREALWGAQAYRHACTALAALLQVVVYTLVVLVVSWRMGVAAVAVAALVTLGLGAFVRLARRAGIEMTHRSRDLASRLLDVVGGVKAIRGMGREHAYLADLEGHADRLEVAERRQIVAVEALHAFQEPILAALLAPGVYLALTVGDIELPVLLVAVFLFHRIVSRSHAAQAEYQASMTAEGAFHGIREEILRAARAVEPAGGDAPPVLSRGIRMEGVSFRHGQRTVLRDLTLEIPAGGVTVVVGPSGTGKTTLLDLVVGLREPDEGRILVDGVPLANLDRRAWRRQIGYVPQEPILLRGTVARNVALGVEGASDGDVEDALRRAGALGFVSALPAGIHAEVGERGGRLSGGERQRVALARALLTRPSLLVLDEPTSELDEATEADVCDALARVGPDVTVLVASHSHALSAVADGVYVLDAGGTVRNHAVAT